MNNETVIDPTNPSTIPNAAPKKSNTGKIIIIILIVVFFLVALPLIFVILIIGGAFGIVKSVGDELEKGSKLACTNGASSLTVYYDEYGINGTSIIGGGFKYDSDEIEDYVSNYSSIESGLISLGNEIVSSSNGSASCALNSADVTTLSASGANTTYQVFGNSKIGYVDLLSDWNVLQSEEADSAYGSHVNSATNVSLGINLSYLANVSTSDSEDLTVRLQSLEDYAKNYTESYNDLFGDSNAETNMSTVTIGKNNDIPAIKATTRKNNELAQVSYFFENSNNTYIITFNVVSGGDSALGQINEIVGTYRFEQ